MPSSVGLTRKRHRLFAGGAATLLFTAVSLDMTVLRRDARAAWMASLPPPALAQLSRFLPGDAAISFALGCSLSAAGKPAAAAPHLKHAAEADPTFARARAVYAGVLVDLHQDQEAYQIAEECLSADSSASEWEIAPALVARGRLHARRSEWPPAQQDADRALEWDPECVEAMLLRAEVLAHQEAWGQAAEAARRAVNGRPSAAEAWCVLAQAALGQGQARQARQFAEHAVLLQPNSVEAQTALARALLGTGQAEDLPGAAAAINKALDTESASPAARLVRGEILLRRGRLGEAEAWLERVVAWSPQENQARDLLGRVAAKQGNARMACYWNAERARWARFLGEKRALEAKLGPYGYNDTARFDLAKLYARMGLRADALREVRKGLSRRPDPRGLALLRSLTNNEEGKAKPLAL